MTHASEPARRTDRGLIMGTALSVTLGVWRLRLRFEVEDTTLGDGEAT